MKLIVAVINSSDAPVVAGALSKSGYPSTITKSTGGFLNRENAVLLTGIDDKRVNSVLKIVRENTKAREEDVPTDITSGGFKLPSQIRVGGAVVFVLDVEQFVRL